MPPQHPHGWAGQGAQREDRPSGSRWKACAGLVTRHPRRPSLQAQCPHLSGGEAGVLAVGRARGSVLDPRAGQPSQGLSGARAWLGPAAQVAWQVVAGGCVSTPGQRSRCLSPGAGSWTRVQAQGHGPAGVARMTGYSCCPSRRSRPGLSCVKGTGPRREGSSLTAGPGGSVRPGLLRGRWRVRVTWLSPWTLQGPPQARWTPELVAVPSACQVLRRMALCGGGVCLGSAAQGRRARAPHGPGLASPAHSRGRWDEW